MLSLHYERGFIRSAWYRGKQRLAGMLLCELLRKNHKSSDDGKSSIICSPTKLEVLGLCCRLAEPWNAAETRVSNRWQNPGSSPQFDISSCVWNTCRVKWLRRSTLRLYPTVHNCLRWFKAQLSKVSNFETGWESKIMHTCHCTTVLRKARHHPSPQSSKECPANSQLPSAPEFSETNVSALPPVIKET